MPGQIRSQMTIILRKISHKTLIISYGMHGKIQSPFHWKLREQAPDTKKLFSPDKFQILVAMHGSASAS